MKPPFFFSEQRAAKLHRNVTATAKSIELVPPLENTNHERPQFWVNTESFTAYNDVLRLLPISPADFSGTARTWTCSCQGRALLGEIEGDFRNDATGRKGQLRWFTSGLTRSCAR